MSSLLLILPDSQLHFVSPLQNIANTLKSNFEISNLDIATAIAVAFDDTAITSADLNVCPE